MEKGIWRGQKRSPLSTWTNLQVTGSYTIGRHFKIVPISTLPEYGDFMLWISDYFLAEKGGPVSQVEDI